jgi:hypothetical protein
MCVDGFNGQVGAAYRSWAKSKEKRAGVKVFGFGIEIQ